MTNDKAETQGKTKNSTYNEHEGMEKITKRRDGLRPAHQSKFTEYHYFSKHYQTDKNPKLQNTDTIPNILLQMKTDNKSNDIIKFTRKAPDTLKQTHKPKRIRNNKNARARFFLLGVFWPVQTLRNVYS